MPIPSLLNLTQFVLSGYHYTRTYRILTVFEDPEPFCHPVMTTTLSPDPMKLLLLPKSMAYWTLSSTSFIQSASRSFSYSNGMQPLKICICRATCPYLCTCWYRKHSGERKSFVGHTLWQREWDSAACTLTQCVRWFQRWWGQLWQKPCTCRRPALRWLQLWMCCQTLRASPCPPTSESN